VLLAGIGSPPDDAIDSPKPASAPSPRQSKELQIPKPAFGIGSDLVGLGPCGSPEAVICRSFSSSLRGISLLEEASPQTIPRPAFGTYSNGLRNDDDGNGCSSEVDNASLPLGYEVTFATTDRQGLLKYFTSALSDSNLQLNIKEAHVFSLTDGMALEVFVVEGWPRDEAEELRCAVLEALEEKSDVRGNRSFKGDSKLQAAAEAIQYEDWAVDFNLLEIGEKLGKGSSGGLFKGKYLSQDVAIKIIEIDEYHNSEIDSDTHVCAPASGRLQVFKQEVSIMRLVRHKNVVQFIGACSNWPKLCIVTELMAGGSVRDLLDRRMGGLDIASAIKVFRDSARGMDFLHKRGIVHRDMKAANLLIDEHDVVKVCDFGVARLKPTSSIASCIDKCICHNAEMTAETGTYRWMCPEILEHKSYDHKADVYSFAITMWEVLTGGIPYAGLTPLQAAISVVQRGVRPDTPLYVPEALVTLMQRCWHKDPAERPEFSEVLSILENMVIPMPSRGVLPKRRTTHASCWSLPA
jgi:serine/threonine protein kinase